MQKKEFLDPPKRVALFVTCMVDMIYPEVGMATVELLERQGIEVVFPSGQTCCGQPAFNAGYRDEARSLARHFVDVFEPLVRGGQVDALVAPSGSCVAMTSHFYDVLFEHDPHYRQRAAILASVTFELTEFLVDLLHITDVGARFEGKLAYHACCHLLRELGIDRQPRALLEQVAGAEQVALTGSDECCGFGGLFALKNAAISSTMGRRKTQNLAAAGADVAVLCDVSCMTQINGLLTRQGQHCRAVHIAQLLANEVEVAERSQAEKPATPKQAPSRRWQDARG